MTAGPQDPRPRVAPADCTLVYALIPNATLRATVEARAEQILAGVGSKVQHSMAVEGQAAPLLDVERRAVVDELVDSPGLWSAGP